MNSAAVIEKVRAFITESFLYARPDFELANDDALLGSGIVDSMGVMEIVAFIEDEFGLEVDDADITEENLGTVSAIASYVGARTESVSDTRQIA